MPSYKRDDLIERLKDYLETKFYDMEEELQGDIDQRLEDIKEEILTEVMEDACA